ncbi:MAG TPA: sugar nucleotide-binding protein [Acidimicrobiales bacterium]|nr:sugar nucleotide-binding protein [Acidimicrobiales bacterium]
MRVYLTGASGFVGSNVARVFAAHGAVLIRPVHQHRPDGAADEPAVDLTDPDATRASVEVARPDAVVHCAILNDFARLYADRRAGWDAYVGATRTVVDAANAVGAKVVLVSTDWVFDGTQSGADEATPPNPVNLYGVLKVASELVVTERAVDGAVARISGVNGVHWARPHGPRRQDAGFGYFVTSLVDRLSAGEPFLAWEGDDLNMIATPTLASDGAELMWRIIEQDRRGIFHCCGGETVGRRQLAELAAGVFELDPSLLRFGPPPPGAVPPGPVPYDTSLSATVTAAALDVELPSVREQLTRFRAELKAVG